MKKPAKTWNPTRCQSIYRHKSGIYYARLTVNGRKTWRSLRTDLITVARVELGNMIKDEAARNEVAPSKSTGKRDMTLGGAADLWLQRINDDPARKPRTKKYWTEIYNSLKRESPDLFAQDARRVNRSDCERWARDYAAVASPSRYNNALGALKNILEVAVEHGARLTNPAKGLKRQKPVEKDLTSRLPDRSTFADWVSEIRRSPSRWGNDCADLVEFFAYSGMRHGEAKNVLWQHVDFTKEEILVMGDPEEGTNNRTLRRIPMIGDMKSLLHRLSQRLTGTDPDDRVLAVTSASEAMKSASDRLGIPPLTHHDLRHFFATICIESGVDIPTVSKWLGHKDGGALAMRVYGHLRNEHSKAAAAKVSFKS